MDKLLFEQNTPKKKKKPFRRAAGWTVKWNSFVGAALFHCCAIIIIQSYALHYYFVVTKKKKHYFGILEGFKESLKDSMEIAALRVNISNNK